MSGQTKNVATLDTSAILLLVIPIDEKDLERKRRQERADETMRDLKNQGTKFIIPAPVITELSIFGGSDEETAAALVDAVLGRLTSQRVESFDEECAGFAAKMLRDTFHTRPEGEPRDVIKVDAMIAAVAHRWKSTYLVTGNGKHMKKHLDAIKSDVEVLRLDSPKAKGQLRFIDVSVKTQPEPEKKAKSDK